MPMGPKALISVAMIALGVGVICVAFISRPEIPVTSEAREPNEVDAYTQPDRVEVALVRPADVPEGLFVERSEWRVLTPGDQQEIARLVTEVREDGWNSLCVFNPDAAFRFSRLGTTHHVVACFGCGQLAYLDSATDVRPLLRMMGDASGPLYKLVRRAFPERVEEIRVPKELLPVPPPSVVWESITRVEGGDAETSDSRKVRPMITARPTGTVEAERSTVSGDLEPEVVDRVLRRHGNEIRYCYERQLEEAPYLKGHAVVQLEVDARGEVTDARIIEGAVMRPTMESCTLARMKRWKFPSPPDGRVALVQTRWAFSPGSIR